MVTESCLTAGISRGYFYKQLKENPEFAERWEAAEAQSTEVLEQLAYQRAATGSDTLMIFLLKARKPDTYRENVHHQHDHSVDGTIQLSLPDGQQPIELPAAKRREAARLLLEAHADENTIEGTASDIPDENQSAAA